MSPKSTMMSSMTMRIMRKPIMMPVMKRIMRTLLIRRMADTMTTMQMMVLHLAPMLQKSRFALQML